MSNEINQKSLQALECLQAGDRGGFSSRLSLCYCHILEVVRVFLAENGLPEAAGLITPLLS